MLKKLFGNQQDTSDHMTLTIPNRSTYNQLLNQNRYLNKDSFWTSVKPAVNYLSKFNSISWIGEEESLKIKAEKVTKTILAKKYSVTKDILVDFFCLFFGEQSNVLALADVMLPVKEYQLAKEIVEKGAMCLADLPTKLSWPEYKPSYWGDNLDSKTWERWQDSETTSILSMMSGRLSGAAPQMMTKRSYYVPNFPYIIPESSMIQMVTGKECPKLIGTEIPDPKTQNFTYFCGDDLFGNEETLQNLILSGVLQSGKTKIGINVIKKFSSLITLRQFPENAKTVMSRNEYVAKAALLTFGEPSSMSLPDKPLTDDKFLKDIYSNIQVTKRYMLMDILSGSVKNLQYEFYYAKHNALSFLNFAITNTLIECDVYLKNQWVDFKDFVTRVNYNFSLKKFGYIYPDTFSLRPDNVKDENGAPLPVTDFKSHFHDRILSAMIEGLAAIGGLELLFNSDGEISYLKLSEAGKWYLGFSKEMPQPKVSVNLKEALEIDDHTGLILIKNPNFPYINLLPEFAEKMTDTRYCFSEKAFLKKCDNPEVLSAKIKRFKMFILPEPGPSIQGRIDKMLSNCDLVKKTTGGSTYQLFDIDPKNSRLHNIIVEDKEIRKNTLRVEGCKLLVKTKFIPEFLDKLKENGFLTSCSY